MTSLFFGRSTMLHRARASWAYRAAGTASVAGLMLASSCASNRMMSQRSHATPTKNAAVASAPAAKSAPELPSYADKLARAKEAAAPSTPRTNNEIEHAVVDEDTRLASVRQLSHEVPAPETKTTEEAPGVVVAKGPRPWAPDLNHVPTLPPLNDAAIAAAVYHPATPRVQLAAAQCPTDPACGCNVTDPNACPQEDGSDEYVCDGGDSGYPVHYESGQITGLESEDTVVEYRDREGRQRVKESNKVCVYAPRFGVARSVTEAIGEVQVEKVAGAHDRVSVAGLSHETLFEEKRDVNAPLNMRTRERLSGMGMVQADGEINKDVSPLTRAKLVNAFQEYGFVEANQFRVNHPALLKQFVMAADEWSYKLQPQVIAKDLAGQDVVVSFSAAEAVGTEDRRTEGELKIVKLADRSSAHVGETVSFKIAIENVGGRELRDVRVLDNLSPRLELVEGSVACRNAEGEEVPGELIVEPGSAGGTMLEFRLEQALAGKTSAIITFECRVR